MVDLLTSEYAAASPPGLPRNINRCSCVIGATPSRSEDTDRQEKPLQGARHRPETNRVFVMNAHETLAAPI